MSAAELEGSFLDLHAREVHAFSLEMANIGYNRMTDLLRSMLRSESWRSFTDGLGSYAFLPGEFDYFLTQQGIRREDVMKLPDIAIKAMIEEAMDERRTGEDGYRRTVLQARAANPQRPGRPIEPFGCTQAEARSLSSGGGTGELSHRPPLGMRVRRFRNTGGESSKIPSEVLPLAERLRRSALRLDDQALSDLIAGLVEERRRRHPERERAAG